MPGDIVLADHSFSIQVTVKQLYCAEVKLPAFTKGKKQLSAIDVESSQGLSRVHIHVERVIGMLQQKYTILESTLPIAFLSSKNNSTSLTDKIVTVCAVLCNCCDSVIPGIDQTYCMLNFFCTHTYITLHHMHYIALKLANSCVVSCVSEFEHSI